MKGKKILALIAAAALSLSAPVALADSISFDGTVSASSTYELLTPIGGTADTLDATAGEKVTKGSPVVTLKTTKVYASEDGTVTGIFGQPGDDTQTVATKYGAVMYVEPQSEYTIAASTENAYNSTDTKFVHIGETVYLSCYSDGDHTGEGRITSVSGTDYTVEVTSGEFLVGETVNVFRTDTYKAASRIGRGTLSRSNPVAMTGSGSIVSIAVADGAQVKRGDLLFETLDGDFDGLYMSGATITSPIDGYIAKLNTSVGSAVGANSSVATLYPADSMRIEAEVSEGDLGSIAVGDKVSIELQWNQDNEVTYPGTITMISAIATEAQTSSNASTSTSDESDTTYTVYIDFTPDENTRYGMNAIITTADAATDAGQSAATDATQSAADSTAKDATAAAKPADTAATEAKTNATQG